MREDCKSPSGLRFLEGADQDIVSYLQKALRLEGEDIYRYDGLFDFASLESMTSIDRPDLKYADYRPVTLAWANDNKLYPAYKS